MDLQQQLETGKNAEDFKRYIDEHPYFRELLERVKLEYAKQILSADPLDSHVLMRGRISMIAIEELTNAISGDIYMGQQAYEKLNGLSEEPKGLL